MNTSTAKSIPNPTQRKVALDDLLAQLCQTGKSVSAVKAMVEALPLETIELTPHIDKLVHELNQRYSIVSLEGQAVIQDETITAKGFFEVTYMKLSDFNLRMRNRSAIDRTGKIIPAGQAWLGHPQRREYTRVVFEPNGAESTEYNLYQGLGVTPKAGDCTLLRQHIRNIICCGDADIFSYLEAWVADIVQKPAHLPGVAVVLRGAEGTGKSIFGKAILKLTAPHSVHIMQAMQVMGRFNSILKAMLFAFLDEAFWAGDKQLEGVLKGLITESEIVVEHKGKEPIKLSNYARFLMASNNEWVVPAGNGARRFLVLDVSDKRKGDIAYFKALADHIEKGGLAAWAHHLANLDCSRIELRLVPKTKALFDQKLESLNSMQRFIFEMLMEGRNRPLSPDDEWALEVPKNVLHQCYLDNASEVGERRRGDLIKFSNTLKSTLGINEDRAMVNGKRERIWCFPNLHTCRQRFEKHMDADIDWPNVKECRTITKALGRKF